MKKMRKLVIFVIAAVMLLGNVAMAQSLVFTDIENHWSEEYVENIYKRKITTGYGDATYRPDNTISGLETMTMLSKLLQYDSETENYTEKYKSELKSNSIPEWAQEYIAFMLSEEIVLADELHQFMSNGQPTNIKRYEMVLFIGRVLEAYGGKELRVAYTIPYEDEMFIPQNAKAYVDLMLSEGLLDPNSNGGRFLPLNNLTRGETAKLISLTADLLDEALSNPPEEEEEEEPQEPEEEEEDDEDEYDIAGFFNNIMEGSNRTILSITDESNQLQTYELKSNVKVYIDGKNSRLSDLKEGQYLKMVLDDDLVKEIDGESSEGSFKGYFVRYLTGGNDVLTLRNEKDATRVYTVPKNVKVSLNGRDTSLSAFEEGDVVRIIEKNDKIVAVQGRSMTTYVDGEITNKGTENDQYLEVTTRDDEIITVYMDKSTKYIRDRKSSKFSSLRLYDEVRVELEYGEVKLVEAEVIRREVEGYIRTMAIGTDQVTLEVESADGELEQFILGEDVEIEIGEEEADIYDLRVNYFVEVEIEGKTVVAIYTSRKVATETLSGVVDYIDNRGKFIEIEYLEEGRMIIKELILTDKTTYSKKTGTTKLSGIDVGDVVLVTGKTEKGEFIVEHIFVIDSK